MKKQKYHRQYLSRSQFLVTGGAGFIGSNLVDYLLHFGAGKVRVLDNFSTGTIDNVSDYLHLPEFDLVEGDIRNLATCRQAMEGMDYVLHQAALGSVPRSIEDPLTSNDVNVSGFLNVLEAARGAGIKRMVYAASSSTYGDHPDLPKIENKIGKPLSPYAVTKYVNELYADVFSGVYNFHTIGLRYFNVFGPKQNPRGPYAAVIPLFIKSALNGTAPVINGDGNTSRDFTYVENAVQANIKALFAPGITHHEVLNIAVGQSTNLNQLWQHISAIAGSRIPALYAEARKGDIRHSLAAIEKAKELIDYEPRITVQDGLKMTLNWYRQHYTGHLYNKA
jgi:UDP-N-acetylglucosamine/UDP-N-acetylgalactosamine 4-epimerase